MYFHGAKACRKYELSQRGNPVGFEADGHCQLLEGESACSFSAAIESVIGSGTIRLLEDPKEKRKGLNCIMKQATQKKDWKFDDNMLEATAVFRIDVTALSCKAHV